MGRKVFHSGIGATITGDLLTTCGDRIEDDITMLTTMGVGRVGYEI